jgi:Short C-terminal domain
MPDELTVRSTNDATFGSKIRVGCRSCKGASLVPAQLASWKCAHCESDTYAVRCPYCNLSGPHDSGNRWQCPWCLHKVAGTLSLSTASALAATLAEFGDDVDDPNRVILSEFVVVVAQGPSVFRNTSCTVAAGSRALTLMSPAWESRVIRYVPGDLLSVDVGGPGIVQPGGGFIGGGFGFAGAVEGMAVAAALNKLTRRTKINNVVAIVARESAFVLYNSTFNPSSLEMAFVPIKSAISQVQARQSAGTAPSPPMQLSKYDQLKQLGELRASGLLTEAEFESEKAKLLAGP